MLGRLADFGRKLSAILEQISEAVRYNLRDQPEATYPDLSESDVFLLYFPELLPVPAMSPGRAHHD